MDLHLFFDHFSTLAAAPNGIPQLRQLILQLAVRGQLVPQDPTDEPASVLLERIREEKERLVQEKKIKKTKLLPPIEDLEISYDIPENWCWTRLGEIGDWGAGATPDRKNPDFYSGSIRWLKSGELNDGYVSDSEEKITELALQKCSLRLNQVDDVLIAMYGATIGKVAILKTVATTNQAVCACTCFAGFYNKYLCLLLKAYKPYFLNQGAGAAQPNISRDKIIHTAAPLPPIAEQKRIVAKVDELMALCDRLATQQHTQRSHLHQLQTSAIAQLLSAADAAAFAQHWHAISQNFELLFDDEGAIAQLRQAILQLAVQGKLVPQDPSDEAASVLLEKAISLKQELIKVKKLQPSAKLSAIEDEKNLFGIPKGWIWTRIGVLCPSIVPNRDKPQTFSGGYPWITLPNFDEVLVDLKNVDSSRGLSEAEVVTYSARVIPKSSVLMSCVGRFGLVAVADKDVVANQQIHAFVISPVLDSKYVAYTIKSQTQFLASSAQATTISYLNKTKCESLPFPLPPLAEQKRIVAKVEELMGLCDQLQQHLSQRHAQQAQLATAAMQQVLAREFSHE
jgi:type I restriction enzyme, S subunit